MSRAFLMLSFGFIIGLLLLTNKPVLPKPYKPSTTAHSTRTCADMWPMGKPCRAA